MALFLKSDLYLALFYCFYFFFFFFENGMLLSAAFMDRWRDGWKSTSKRPIWSAFNGLQGTEMEGRIVPFFLLLGQSVVSGTFFLE